MSTSKTLSFTVASSKLCKKQNEDDANVYCNKLVNKRVISVETPFGTSNQERQTTLYMFTDQQNPVGHQADLDLNWFDIVEREFEILDVDPLTGEEKRETITLKYAYPKGV